MNSFKRSVIERFGTTVFAQKILGLDINQLGYLVRKYEIVTRTKSEIYNDAASIVAGIIGSGDLDQNRVSK